MKTKQKTTRLQRLNCQKLSLQSLSLEQLENLAGGAKENGQGTVECPACIRLK